MSANLNIDDLLWSAARTQNAAAGAHASGAPDVPDEAWSALERHLQARSEALAAGVEAPGLPRDLAQAMLDLPELRAAFRALAAPVADAVRQARAAAPASADSRFAAEAERPEGALSAVLRCLKEKWAALSVIGLDIVQPELILARGAASTPIALQGRVGDNYLVAMSLSGDFAKGCALDVQCQEAKPGQSTPRPVPSFCLKAEDGRRFHSRDRVARVEPLTAGRHVFHLEVTGRKQGSIVLCLEGEEEAGQPGKN